MELGGLTPERALDIYYEKRSEVAGIFKSAVGENGSLTYLEAKPLFRELGAKFGIGNYTSDRALLLMMKIIGKDTFDTFSFNDYVVSSNYVPKDARGRTAKLADHPFAETLTNAVDKHTLLEILFISDLFAEKEAEFKSLCGPSIDSIIPVAELCDRLCAKGIEWGFGNTLGDRILLELFPSLDLEQLPGLSFTHIKEQINRRRPPGYSCSVVLAMIETQICVEKSHVCNELICHRCPRTHPTRNSSKLLWEIWCVYEEFSQQLPEQQPEHSCFALKGPQRDGRLGRNQKYYHPLIP